MWLLYLMSCSLYYFSSFAGLHVFSSSLERQNMMIPFLDYYKKIFYYQDIRH